MTPQEEINQAIIVQVKNLRRQIDAAAMCISTIGFGYSSQSANRSLLLAKAWTGKMLGYLGDPTPYVNDGKRKEVGDIEPTSDRVTTVEETEQLLGISVTDASNQIGWIDRFRQVIQHQIDFTKGINTQGMSREYAIARTNVYTHLCEARFHLGFLLAEIREFGKEVH